MSVDTATDETVHHELDAVPVPAGHACGSCGSPVDTADQFCNTCGMPQAAAPVAEAPATHILQCRNCGAQINVPAEERSLTCPFCDTNIVVELPEDATRQRPEFIVGFTITPEQALEKFRAWLAEGGLFRPGDLLRAKIEGKMRGVYLPFWSFSMLAESWWQAQIGEYWYRTETYTVVVNGKTQTRTRQVRETEWWPLTGKHHRYYSGYLVSGSRGLPQSYAERIKPFRLESLRRYQPYFLAGWLSEEYSVERDEALTMCQQEFQRQEDQNITAFLPGDTNRSLVTRTSFRQVNSDLTLLPVYLLSYRYGEKLFRFLINGQTGKVAGDKPYSRWRIGVAVGVAIAAIIVLWWVFTRR